MSKPYLSRLAIEIIKAKFPEITFKQLQMIAEIFNFQISIDKTN